MALGEMGFGLNGIGLNGYWPNWELDQVALDEMALDEMGLDKVAIPRSFSIIRTIWSSVIPGTRAPDTGLAHNVSMWIINTPNSAMCWDNELVLLPRDENIPPEILYLYNLVSYIKIWVHSMMTGRSVCFVNRSQISQSTWLNSITKLNWMSANAHSKWTTFSQE